MPSAAVDDSDGTLELVRERYCYVVVRGGKIIHEKYYANDSSTAYETDSAAKTMMATPCRAVWTHRSWDLDKPLAAFGVNTSVFGGGSIL